MNHVLLRRVVSLTALSTMLCLASIAARAGDSDASATQGAPAMKMSMDAPASGAQSSPSTAAYEQGMAGMMQGMHAPYTGDADADFVSHMIPHHEGAVSMAQVEREYGKDPEMRKLALDIIKAQEKEIALMKRWQAKHAAK
ncbi:DUF305 domain-containing protein [Pararobbsia alpina]|uniref:CopM family metallochaperone n=1 Tax=Pararobbsia alpina TaxID=621374 RepID=UPI0039A68976